MGIQALRWDPAGNCAVLMFELHQKQTTNSREIANSSRYVHGPFLYITLSSVFVRDLIIEQTHGAFGT